MARREACATILEDIVLQMQTIMEGDIPVIVVVEAVAGAEANEATDMGETVMILVILVLVFSYWMGNEGILFKVWNKALR